MNRALVAHTFLAVLIFACVSLSPISADARSPRLQSGSLAARLIRMQEIRRIDVVIGATDDRFTFDKPGLTLTFRVELPEDRKLLELNQPSAIRAFDSTNKDLTLLEAAITGRREYIELVQTWDSSPSEFRLKLANPDRSATRFSLESSVNATTYTGTEDIVMDVSTKWTPLDSAFFYGQDYRCKLTTNNGNMQLTFEPGTIKSQIEKITLSDGSTTLETNSSWWNDQSITYIFEGKPIKNIKAQLRIRTGLETSPLVISIKDQLLP